MEVTAADRAVEVGGARLRTLLTLLAVEAGRPVPADRLIADLWEDRAPAAAPNALQSLVSRLRAAIGAELVESRNGSYRLAVPRRAVDAHDFEARVAEARGLADPEERAAALRAALALWRGPALVEAAGLPFAEGPAARLESLRSAALEERLDADLELGRHERLIPELKALAAADPLREPLRGRLMRALYGAGRQADALAEYSAIKRALAEELGVDPGPELRDLHLAVLRQDLALRQPITTRPNGTAAASGASTSTNDAADPDGATATTGTIAAVGPARAAGSAEAVRAAGIAEATGAVGAAETAATAATTEVAGPARATRTAEAVGAFVTPGSVGAVGGAGVGGVGEAGVVGGAGGVAGPGHESARWRGNLRARLTSFIGRDRDLARVCGLLAAERLVTLTGPGGAGKTRLAQETGERLPDPGEDGVWFVELAPVTDPREVPATVLATLGLREAVLMPAGRGRGAEAADPLERLTAALAERRLLLILDNCEHLLDAAAALADRVLAFCPGVRIMATSREPLGITGETLWPVEPLEPPPPSADAATALAYPAPRLFADRVAAVSPGFAVTDANAARVVAVCRALDGMPLAIELAAARLRSMTLDQLAARLGDRFRLLNAGSRTALPRHQTLRAVVEWSWELLDEAERTLWRRLAIFPGGATLESAEEVCSGPGLPAGDVLDTLTALADKSLVLVAGPERGPRYRMLETIRAYGLERLAEAGEEADVRRAHALHFADLAETAEPHLYRHDQLRWLDRLIAEHDNTHAALRWALAERDAVLALRFCAGLGWYWFLRGQLGESADNIMRVLSLPGLPEDRTTALALALGGLTAIDSRVTAGHAGDWLLRARDIARGLPEQDRHPLLKLMAVTLAGYMADWDEDALGELSPLLEDRDPWVRGVGHFIHGQLSYTFGRTGRMEADFAAAEAAFTEAGDRWGLSFTLTAQAELLGRRGEHRAAIARFEEALRAGEALGGGAVTVLQTHIKLANELYLVGERTRALRMLNGAMRDAERTAVPEAVAVLHYQLGEFARREGDHDEARRRLERAERLVPLGPGPPQCRGMILAGRAQLDLETGDDAAARARLREALWCSTRALDYPVTALVLTGCAALALHDGRPGRAAELLGAAEALRGSRDLSQPDEGAAAERAKAALGEAAFEAAYRRGLARTFDGVLEEFGLERPERNKGEWRRADGEDAAGREPPEGRNTAAG
ncbi:BTAD domain-containing putative transcriptional regulator [Spirillospora sp. NPDC127200]